MSSTSTRRAGGAARASAGSLSTPLINASLLAAALAYGLWLLVNRGRIGWPPHQLLANLFTVAGCLALIGPVVLLRRDAPAADAGLGDLLWLTGGLLVWLFDAAALAQGQWRTLAPATPVNAIPLGLTVLAVMVAGWRTRGPGRGWSWTNVTGWLLGLFWVGLGLGTLLTNALPAR